MLKLTTNNEHLSEVEPGHEDARVEAGHVPNKQASHPDAQTMRSRVFDDERHVHRYVWMAHLFSAVAPTDRMNRVNPGGETPIGDVEDIPPHAAT